MVKEMEELLQENDKPTGLSPIPRSTTKLSGLRLYRAWPFCPDSSHTSPSMPEPKTCLLVSSDLHNQWVALACQHLPANSSALSVKSKRTTLRKRMGDWGQNVDLLPLYFRSHVSGSAMHPHFPGWSKRDPETFEKCSFRLSCAGCLFKSNSKLPSLFHYLPFYSCIITVSEKLQGRLSYILLPIFT